MSADHFREETVLAHAEHPHRAWPFRRSTAMRYGVAMAAVIVAFSIRYAIFGELQNRLVFTFFVPAAMVAAWYGGVGPGILATVLGLLLGDYFFLPPGHVLWPLAHTQLIAVVVYVITTVLCVILCERLHRYIRGLEDALDRVRHHHADATAADHVVPDRPVPATPGRFPRHSAALRYGLAGAVVLLAFALRYAFFGTDPRFPFIFFVPAAIIATWYGGMGPGLFATAGGLMLGDYFFLSEHTALGPVRESERVAIGLYAVTTALCVLLFEHLHTRIRRLEHALERARHHHPGPHPEAPAAPPAPAGAAH